MEIRRLARKLRPLMPKEVDHWLRVHETADPELRTLIERQIQNTARRMLGPYEAKILLSLPPKSRIGGEIRLGTVLYDTEKHAAGLSRGELLQNLAIFGRSGAGKTNLAFHLLEQLSNKNIPFLFLDWKRTARHLLPRLKRSVGVYTPGRPLSPLRFNPFVPPPGMEPSVYFGHVVDVMGDAYTLGDGARSVLHKALTKCLEGGNLAPTVGEILEEVNRVPGTERVRGWKISAVRALESLATADLTTTDRLTQEQLVQTLTRQSTIIELDALSQASKRFLVPLLALWVYSVGLTSKAREQLNLVVVLEEAHNVLYRQDQRANEPLLSMLLRQCRELGVAFMVIDQHPHLISPAAIGNTYTSICLNQKDPRDISKAAALSLVPEDEKRLFSRLPVGQAVVKLQDRWHEPFLIRIPTVDVQKGAVTDDLLAQYLSATRKDGAGKWGGSGQKPGVFGELGQVRRVQRVDDGLSEEELRFLEDVVQHPDDGVRTRYQRLKVSGEKGNRLKLGLIAGGFLDAQTIPIEQSRKVVLRLTKRAREAIGLDASGIARESIAHEYWKRFYAKRFEKDGYRVQIEAPRTGGRVDVLAEKDGKRIAIEIETGKSDAVENVRGCLRAGFDQVIVAATNGAAMTTIVRVLALEGLCIEGRVMVHLSGWTPTFT